MNQNSNYNYKNQQNKKVKKVLVYYYIMAIYCLVLNNQEDYKNIIFKKNNLDLIVNIVQLNTMNSINLRLFIYLFIYRKKG